MEMRPAGREPPRIIGVAGRCSSEQEKSYVKQAVFLLRYRIRFLAGDQDAPLQPLPQDD